VKVRRFWSLSLAGQLVLIVLVAMLAGQALSLLIFADERRMALRAANREQVLARTAALVRLLDETPPSLHPRILAASSSPQLRFRVGDASAVAADEPWHGRNRLARRLAGLLDDEEEHAVLVDVRDDRLQNLIGFQAVDERTGRPRYWRGHPGAVALVVSVRLGDGRWLNAETGFPPAPAWAVPSLVTLGLSAVLVGLAVVLAVRRVTRPMARLAVAAEALGRGEATPPLPEVGPVDVRGTVRAFNRMQARIKRFVDDRTRMLAAVSHDLRTPITSLRLGPSSSRTRRRASAWSRPWTRCSAWSRRRWPSRGRRRRARRRGWSTSPRWSRAPRSIWPIWVRTSRSPIPAGWPIPAGRSACAGRCAT
jgi:signal transduction histidine kinase